MKNTPRYLFRKEDKLKSRKAIEELFASGNHFVQFPFKVIWLPKNEQQVLQAGISVSSRNFKKAVDRNRIKRLMREAYRLQKNDLHELLVKNNRRISVFILYLGKELPDYSLVYDKFTLLIQHLMKSA